MMYGDNLQTIFVKTVFIAKFALRNFGNDNLAIWL